MNGTEMAQLKDPAIKLFGRKIQVPDTQMPPSSLSRGSCRDVTKVEVGCSGEDCFEEQNKTTESMEDKDGSLPNVNLNERQATAEMNKAELENDSSDQEKVLKKPDKIIPCPRCNSLETKFCYFNNYNVNQPRHFCRNCQRYWTAGGTMRNVPIGAGRRKNKHLPSQFRQILASSDGIPVTSVESPDPSTHQLVSPVDATSSLSTSTGNGVVLKFGPEAPLCKSMETTVLTLGDQKRYLDASSVGPCDNVEEPSSSGSSITACSNRVIEALEDATRQENVSLLKSSEDHSSSHPQPMQLHSLTPIVFPWNPGWNNSAAIAVSKWSPGQAPVLDANNPNQAQWSLTPVLAAHGFCPPNIPLNFVPASYWGCVPVWASGTENMSLVGSNGRRSPSSSTSVSRCSGNGSPTLGKHCRDSNLSEEEKPEKCLFAPKTQRINHSNEASKSPFWDALGLKPDGEDAMPNGNCINIETKEQGKGHVFDDSRILGANQAAALSCLSRWPERM